MLVRRFGLAARRVARMSTYEPHNTDYYHMSLGDQEMFGVPRIESTRLQAAARRIAEHFMVYDAIDQTLLEHEAQLDFGDGISPKTDTERGQQQTLVVDVDTEKLSELGKDNVSTARQYLFNEYELESHGLVNFIEDAERLPMHNQLPKAQVQARLRQLMAKSEPKFLSEIANLLAVGGPPDLYTLNGIMQKLLERGYYKPCQVVLDSLLMSKVPLNIHCLTNALSLATLAGKKQVFYSYALLVEQPSTSESRFGDLSKPTPELIDALTFGFAKFKDSERLSRTLEWADSCKVLTSRSLRTSMRFAALSEDTSRARWTLSKYKGQIPGDVAEWARKAGVQSNEICT